MTCHDDGEVRISETHLNSSAFNHCGRSSADRLPSAGRSDTTKYTLKKPHIIRRKLCTWIYVHRPHLRLASMLGISQDILIHPQYYYFAIVRWRAYLQV